MEIKQEEYSQLSSYPNPLICYLHAYTFTSSMGFLPIVMKALEDGLRYSSSLALDADHHEINGAYIDFLVHFVRTFTAFNWSFEFIEKTMLASSC